MTNEPYLSRYGLFEARAPRYTSYPTAPHFTADIRAAHHRSWIRQRPEGSQVSLYIHVPFCRRLCWFCACRTQGTQTLDPVRAYLETLLQELSLLAGDLPKGVTLSRLHWGGGTPTLLAPDMMETLARAIFDVAPLGHGAEFSVEIDPNEIDRARLQILADAGMNRASIGVQDFDPDIQKTIGREQSYAVTARAAEMIRAAGVNSLNTDLLYGLPHQTEERIAQSVKQLITLSPDRIALYGYAHVPWMAKRQKMIPEDALPDAETRLRLFERARDLFNRAGYAGVGIDHFARAGDGLAEAQKAGRLRRNFQGYTDDQAEVLIGVGASSISRFPQGYSQNAPATAAHTQAIREARYSTSRGHVFTDEDRLHARMIEMLMCDFRIDLARLAQEMPVDQSRVMRLLAEVAARFDPLLHLDDTGLSIPEHARPLTRMIAQALDAYDGAGARHSIAV